MLIAVSFAILTVGSVLTLITNHLIGSVAIASLWAMVAIAELARRYCTLKMAVEIEKLPQKTLTSEKSALKLGSQEDIFSTNFLESELTRKQGSPVQLVYSYSHRDESL